MSFDAASLERLKTLDHRLVVIMEQAKARCPFDWRIVQTDRTIEQQAEYFATGRSKIDPAKYPNKADLYKAAKHIIGPGMPLSRAVDVAIVGSEPYHVPSLCFLAGVVRSMSIGMGTPVRWGADWDQDGKLIEPGTFVDLPHFELV
jgi:peptidoglycan LD-endopeptidase CwlK